MRKLEVHSLLATAVVKALRATEKRMTESLSKNKKMNYSNTEQTKKPRRRADDILRNQRRNTTLVANDANGSGGAAVLKALRATERRMEKSLSKKQENEQ